MGAPVSDAPMSTPYQRSQRGQWIVRDVPPSSMTSTGPSHSKHNGSLGCTNEILLSCGEKRKEADAACSLHEKETGISTRSREVVPFTVTEPRRTPRLR